MHFKVYIIRMCDMCAVYINNIKIHEQMGIVTNMCFYQ